MPWHITELTSIYRLDIHNPTLYKEAAKIKRPNKMNTDSVFLGAFRIFFKTFFDTRLRLFSDKT